MKKILIILSVFIFAGCTVFSNTEVKESKIEKEKNTYIKYVKEIQKKEKFTKEAFPFDIDVKYDKLTEDEVRYQVVIDNPRIEMLDVEAVAIHDKPTDDVFPSTGIFEEPMDLIPNKKPEGIILVGYIPSSKEIEDFECEIKVMIKYTYENKKYTTYYVTKK